MKISNLIVLIFFACCFFFISAFTLVVKHRYVHRNYESEEGFMENFKHKDLPKFSVLHIKNLPKVIFIPADSFAMGVQESDASKVRYIMQRDTLIIIADEADTFNAPVNIYCPTVTGIHADHSSLIVKGVLRRNDPWISYRFYLDNSTLSTTVLPSGLRIFQHYRDLFVEGSGTAEVNIHRNTVVHHLKIVNISNVFMENDVRINQFDTEYHNKSTVLTTGTNQTVKIQAQ